MFLLVINVLFMLEDVICLIFLNKFNLVKAIYNIYFANKHQLFQINNFFTSFYYLKVIFFVFVRKNG